jgi:hypothetical protein
MIRIPIVIIAFYLSIVSVFSQTPQAPTDTSHYATRKLNVDEVNFVSSYYRQDGNNAAVTGGIGSERLTDFVTVIDIHLSKKDRKNRLNTFSAEIGMDSYTSASSDKIDPSSISSASSQDQRYYPTFNWTRTNDAKRTSIGAMLSGSFEYDYYSVGIGLHGAKSSKDNNRQLSFRLQTFQDQLSLIYPIELRSGRPTGLTSRNSYSASVGLSQIINTRLQLMLLLDLAYQEGYLSLPFNRVYFIDNTETIEFLPGTRIKIPIGLRGSYFIGDRIILRGFYRYYWDDWQLTAHTAELEASVKITPFISVTPFYRYYNQSSVQYFAPYRSHNQAAPFYTSDYDLSKFDSHFAGLGFRAISTDGIFGLSRWKMIELRYGHYQRGTGLVSNIISVHARFK